MSTAIYRKRIYSSNLIYGDFNVCAQTLREIAAYCTSISGLQIDYDSDPKHVYSSLNLSGGDIEELVYTWRSDVMGAMVLFGAVRDGHTMYDPPDTYVEFTQYSHTGTGDDRAFNDLYLIVQDGQLIGMSCKMGIAGSTWYWDSGFILFYYTDDGLHVAFQGGNASYVSPIYGDLKAFDDTNNRPAGSIIFAGDYELVGRLSNRTLNYTGYGLKTPANKALMYQIYQMDIANKIDKLVEYPVGIKCNDLNITGLGSTPPSYQKIQIDWQKYMHIGEGYWMPYDTYSESFIEV